MLRCLNGLRWSKHAHKFLIPVSPQGLPNQASFLAVPRLREQVCEIFVLAILWWKTKIQWCHPCSPVLHRSTCLEVSLGKWSVFKLPSGKGTVWSHSVAWLTGAFSSKHGRNRRCFFQCHYSWFVWDWEVWSGIVLYLCGCCPGEKANLISSFFFWGREKWNKNKSLGLVFKKKKRLEFLQSTPSLQAQQPFRAHAGL